MLAHSTTTPNPHFAARAPWAVGRYSTGQKARRPHAIGLERGSRDLSKPVPPTCRGVGAVDLRSMVWGDIGPQHNHGKGALRGACFLGGRPILRDTKARGSRAMEVERGKQGLSEPRYRPPLVLMWSSPCPTARGGERPALGHNTTTPSAHCAERAPWAVDRYCTSRTARELRATGVERRGHELSKAMPPISRGVGAVELQPATW